jgi:hypothetical protein
VLCPHYTAGDTQAGGGGSTAINEHPVVGSAEECMEEIRVNIPYLHALKPNAITITTGKVNNTYIYSCNIRHCKAPDTYYTPHYADKSRRGVDDKTKKVGYIVWGSFNECCDLILRIPVDGCSRMRAPIYVDGINGVSIISLPETIMMARHAFQHSNYAPCEIINQSFPCHF